MTNISDIQKQILESDDFVLSETKKIQYGYGLKEVIRYMVDREEEITTESVAEHVYALHLLADYFMPLEDTGKELDQIKVHTMIQYHDIDEIETGDILGYLKTDEQRAEEAKTAERVIQKLPEHMQAEILVLNKEYNAQETAESKFVKALDRIEPLFQVFTENGKKVMHLQKTTSEQSRGLKENYLKPYPYLYRFYRVIEETMEKEGFFHK